MRRFAAAPDVIIAKAPSVCRLSDRGSGDEPTDRGKGSTMMQRKMGSSSGLERGLVRLLGLDLSLLAADGQAQQQAAQPATRAATTRADPASATRGAATASPHRAPHADINFAALLVSAPSEAA